MNIRLVAQRARNYLHNLLIRCGKIRTVRMPSKLPTKDECEYALVRQAGKKRVRCSYGGLWACGTSKNQAYRYLTEMLEENNR